MLEIKQKEKQDLRERCCAVMVILIKVQQQQKGKFCRKAWKLYPEREEENRGNDQDTGRQNIKF
jgi:hypothetical protein